MAESSSCNCCAWCCPDPCSASQSGDGCGKRCFCRKRQTFTEAEWIEAYTNNRVVLVDGEQNYVFLDDELVTLRRFGQGACIEHPNEVCGCVGVAWATSRPFNESDEAWP